MIRYTLFDLDDTLYPPAAGLMQALGQRMIQYMVEHLGMVPPQQAQTLRKAYNERYGSTTRGLVLHHDVDVVEFLAYAHDLPVEDYLKQDADLGCLLDCLHVDKCVFTNAPQFYAERVLTVLGIADRFRKVFALEFSNYRGKPDPTTYERVVAHLGVGDRELMLLDDSRINLIPAAERGWTTVWVNGRREPAERIDYTVGDLWQVAHVFYEIGILDTTHRDEWHRCLAHCPLGERKSGEVSK
ncbi:MAG: pyrimidine 5'-nucleotidase [Candidatus Bipolaricaulia bacterium]